MNPKIECQCGAVQITASRLKPIGVYCCHYLNCQKQSASAFSTSAIFPAEGMWPLSEDVQSQLGIWKRPTDEGNTLECYFYKTCGVRATSLLHQYSLATAIKELPIYIPKTLIDINQLR
ncbi:hypothetical protein BKA59DRAFT_176713 [Fusarium tricinctum]|uniref:CENP-V/GFA domain-containing protein n=1 Tax=Fusarium tricinctum TaxID=61284 RepID=A0A8K0RXQ0_9HYPO|nr:hypothetical protein BKA59DRAFT_176713 [Fusarium tricinctum]